MTKTGGILKSNGKFWNDEEEIKMSDKALEVFFDFACPFSYRASGYLTELLPEFPGLEIIWRPCEAHPRPERYGKHSDLCAMGMYYCRDAGGNMLAYYQRMYKAVFEDKIDIEDVGAVEASMSGVIDPEDLKRVLQSGRYAAELDAANRRIWDELAFPAVPSYMMGDRRLDAAPGVGVTKEQLREFIGS